MPTRTVDIEEDLYERLNALRHDGETLNDVLRRQLPDMTSDRHWTGTTIQAAISSGLEPALHLSPEEVDAIEAADHSVGPPDDPWK